MLEPTWYLTDGDWFAQLLGAPQLRGNDQAVIGQLAQLFGEEAYLNPAKTVATVHVMLLAAEHLADNITYAYGQHDLNELARLIGGLNLLHAHLTQTVQRIAERIDARAFNGLHGRPTAAVQAITDSLSTAGTNGEVCAGHLKEAHIVLRGLIR